MNKTLKQHYEQDVKLALQKQFEYKNPQEIPKLIKIKINRGLGISAQNNKVLQKTIDEIRAISGQQPVITKAKKSIAGFKIREEMSLGVTVTLRREKMYSFLERLINLVLPRIRDFQGLDPKKVDRQGNYTFGINDQLIFPEINYEQVDQTLGFNVSLVTSAKNQKESIALLKNLGLPFKE